MRTNSNRRHLPHFVPTVVFLVAHIGLVLAMKLSPIVATVHAWATIAYALSRVIRVRSPEGIVVVMGYVVACEPLWRAARAMIFYESGKYMVAFLSLLTILRFRLASRGKKVSLVYFALLLPALLVLPEFDRKEVSFNLSGPFALALATFFFGTLRLSTATFGRLFVAMLLPISGLAFLGTFFTVTTEDIDFYSSKVASGGLGQNQASSILGLGALLAFLYLVIDRRHPTMRALVAALGLWCAGQGALTFSRGGVITAVGAAAAAGFFLLRDRRSRGGVVLRGMMVAVLAIFVLVPILDSVTGGAFSERFSSASLTGRDQIIEADLIAFRENPILGTGPGESEKYHALTFRYSSTHTEYSRLLAEHGLFGLAALVLLVWMSYARWRRPAPLLTQAFTAAFTVWSLLFMFHAAMRMAAVSFIFALGAAMLVPEVSAMAHRRLRRAPEPGLKRERFSHRPRVPHRLQIPRRRPGLPA